MHGLINKALQSFIADSFGAGTWSEVSRRAGLPARIGSDGFEAMQLYDDALTGDLLAEASALLRRPRDCLLEDLGTYLVSHPRMEPLRRLLRFGGVSFADFLWSLDDLPGRTRLAVPDLEMPDLEIEDCGPGRFRLTCRGGGLAWGHVALGILRALADDYGALAVLEYRGAGGRDGGAYGGGPDRRVPYGAAPECETIAIAVHDAAHHAGRRFDLAAGG